MAEAKVSTIPDFVLKYAKFGPVVSWSSFMRDLKNLQEKGLYFSEELLDPVSPQAPQVHGGAVHPLAERDSLQIEGSEAVMPSEDPEFDESRRIESSRRLCTKRNLDWTFAATNIIIEASSATFDQLSSPNKPKYGLIGLLMSVIAVSFCIGEFVYRAREAEVVLRRWGYIWWFASPFHDYKPFGTFSEVVGLICAAFQCIFSGIQYAYFSHHADNPLKISVMPLIFAVCVAFTRFSSRDREPLPHRHYP